MELDEEVPSIVPISKARMDNGMFSCLKCGFVCGKEDAFYSHIQSTHSWPTAKILNLQIIQTEGTHTEFWCPECSMTFVTKSSLSMHLKGSHEYVKDVQIYLEKIGYEGEIPLLDNQCDICFSLFKESWELEKHIRVHGMAFLRKQKLKNSHTSSKSSQKVSSKPKPLLTS